MHVITAPKTPSTPAIERVTVSIREASAMLGVSERTIHNMLRRGDIFARKAGSRVLIPTESIRQFLDGPNADE